MTAAADHLYSVARMFQHRELAARHNGDPRIIRQVEAELEMAAAGFTAAAGDLASMPKYVRDIVAACLAFVEASEALQVTRVERPGLDMSSGDVALLDERWRLCTRVLHREAYQIARQLDPSKLTATGGETGPESHGERRRNHG